MCFVATVDYNKPIYVVHCHEADNISCWYEIGYTNNIHAATGFARQFESFGGNSWIKTETIKCIVPDNTELNNCIAQVFGANVDVSEDDIIQVYTTQNGDIQYYTTDKMNNDDMDGILEMIDEEVLTVGMCCSRLIYMSEYLKNQMPEFKPFLEFIFSKYIQRAWCVSRYCFEEIPESYLHELDMNQNTSYWDVIDINGIAFRNNYTMEED